jgi:ferredoxin-NADP reductase
LKRTKVGTEIPLRAFGGDFVIKTADEGIIPFVAGGVGITPLLGQLDHLDLDKLRLIWIIRLEDIDFVLDVCKEYLEMAKHAKVFFTGAAKVADHKVNEVRKLGASVEKRRPRKEDFDVAAATWYLCAGNPLRATLLEWLDGKKVLFENFDY